MTSFDPDWAVPTSELLHEWLDSKGLSVKVAASIRHPRDERRAAEKMLVGVLDDAVVTEDVAGLLHRVTDVSAAFWLAFDRNYRKAVGRQITAEIESDPAEVELLRRARRQAQEALIAEYEAEHGEITQAEMDALGGDS